MNIIDDTERSRAVRKIQSHLQAAIGIAERLDDTLLAAMTSQALDLLTETRRAAPFGSP